MQRHTMPPPDAHAASRCLRSCRRPCRSALLAEGLHSLADVANQLLLKHGVIRSRREPTKEHQYGFRECGPAGCCLRWLRQWPAMAWLQACGRCNDPPGCAPPRQQCPLP